ncbi:unnamed protein product [Malus baccata var. baccata]
MCKCRSHGTFPLFGLQSSHLNICYYHQDLHRRPLRPGSRPRFCGDRRALLLIGAWRLPRRPGVGRALQRHPFSGLVDSADERFARQYRCGPPPEFPLASPRSGIVHHLSGPDRHARTRTLLRRSRSVGGATPRGIPPVSFLTPYGFDRPLTRTHVRLLGPCFKTGRMGSSQADAGSTQLPKHAWTARAARHDRVDGVSSGVSTARALAVAAIRVGPRPEPIGGPACDRSTSDRGASPAPIRFPPDNFKHSLTLFSKSFSSFPRGTCLLSVSRPYLALDRIYRPIGAAFPNNPTRRQRLVVRQGPGTTGLSPSPAPPSSGLGPGPPLRTLLQTTIRTPTAPDSQAGLFPVRSPLLGESSRALGLMASGATCVQRLDGSRDSAIHTKYRISLRSSSMREPRYPLPRVVLTYRRRRRTRPRTVSGAAGARSFVQIPWRSTRRCSFVRPGTGSRDEGDAGPEGPPTPDVETGSRVVLPCRFDNDPSAGSPTETLLRLLLPLNDKVQWTSRDVAGSEPPASPRSEHFTGPFNR